MAISRGKGVREVEESEGVMEGDWTSGGEHAVYG